VVEVVNTSKMEKHGRPGFVHQRLSVRKRGQGENPSGRGFIRPRVGRESSFISLRVGKGESVVRWEELVSREPAVREFEGRSAHQLKRKRTREFEQ